MALIHHIPWLMLLLARLPRSMRAVDELRRDSEARVNKLRTEGSHVKDLYSYLVRNFVSYIFDAANLMIVC